MIGVWDVPIHNNLCVPSGSPLVKNVPSTIFLNGSPNFATSLLLWGHGKHTTRHTPQHKTDYGRVLSDGL